MLQTRKLQHWPLAYRLILAGVLTGLVAIVYPQVMGTGYDTISESFSGKIEIGLLLGILLAKLVLTPVILGLGVPAGLIGPSLFIGALAGAVLGFAVHHLTDVPIEHVGLYAMLGMGAMMAAVLNAPLAALIALLELTYSPNIILPGMIAIVVSNLTARYVFNTPSIFLASLQAQGLDYRLEPIAQILNRASVAKVMTKNFSISSAKVSAQQAQQLVEDDLIWLLVKESDLHTNIFPVTNIANFLQRDVLSQGELVDLNRIPAERYEIVKLNLRATLHEALQLMDQRSTDLLCIYDHTEQLIGLLSRSQIENYYNNKQYV